VNPGDVSKAAIPHGSPRQLEAGYGKTRWRCRKDGCNLQAIQPRVPNGTVLPGQFV